MENVFYHCQGVSKCVLRSSISIYQHCKPEIAERRGLRNISDEYLDIGGIASWHICKSMFKQNTSSHNFLLVAVDRMFFSTLIGEATIFPTSRVVRREMTVRMLCARVSRSTQYYVKDMQREEVKRNGAYSSPRSKTSSYYIY